MHLKLHFRRFVRYVNIGGPKKTGKTIYYYIASGFERNYISDATILIANLMRRKLLLCFEGVSTAFVRLSPRKEREIKFSRSILAAFFRFSQCTFSNQECEEINHWDVLASACGARKRPNAVYFR